MPALSCFNFQINLNCVVSFMDYTKAYFTENNTVDDLGLRRLFWSWSGFDHYIFSLTFAASPFCKHFIQVHGLVINNFTVKKWTQSIFSETWRTTKWRTTPKQRRMHAVYEIHLHQVYSAIVTLEKSLTLGLMPNQRNFNFNFTT